MCPLTMDELDAWAVYKKGVLAKYPTHNKEFRAWLKINPFEVRKEASKQKVTNDELGGAL